MNIFYKIFFINLELLKYHCPLNDDSENDNRLKNKRGLKPYVKYGGRSPKFIWTPCHVMCTVVTCNPRTPPPPPYDIRNTRSQRQTTYLCNPLTETVEVPRGCL
jgi:hypothetical protein